jgi:hypothetical protein
MFFDTRAELVAGSRDWFSKIWATFGLLLFASTWKLWTPQSIFPQVPFVEWLCRWPAWIDWICLVGISGSLLVCLIAQTRLEFAARASFLIFVTVLVLLDQHRLQPWVYNLVILGVFLGFQERMQANACLRWITISIYFYSGISKLDYQFANSLGQEIAVAMSNLLKLDTVDWSPEHWQGLALSLPVTELLIGILLCFRTARTWSVPMACLFHAALIVVLGPGGLHHKPAVIIWNLFFIAQLIYLFWPALNPGAGRVSALDGRRPVATLICLSILLFPATRFVGISDSWPAWELYAPRGSRVKVELFAMPASLKRFATNDQLPAEIDLNRMSLELLNVPVYPQDRFQIGVVLGLLQQPDLNGKARVTVFGESDRFTGERKATILSGKAELRDFARKFWLNALPRVDLP